MELKIDQSVYEEMLRAAKKAAPLEACGLCGGSAAHITKFYELTNADASSEHFSMLPQEQFAVIKDMRAKGIKLLAIWHSHPATPARMSEEDLRLAYTPDVVYLILSLASKECPELRGFTIRNGKPEPVCITITTSNQTV